MAIKHFVRFNRMTERNSPIFAAMCHYRARCACYAPRSDERSLAIVDKINALMHTARSPRILSLVMSRKPELHLVIVAQTRYECTIARVTSSSAKCNCVSPPPLFRSIRAILLRLHSSLVLSLPVSRPDLSFSLSVWQLTIKQDRYTHCHIFSTGLPMTGNPFRSIPFGDG